MGKPCMATNPCLSINDFLCFMLVCCVAVGMLCVVICVLFCVVTVCCCQGKALLKFVEAISEQTMRSTVAMTAARGRGKSAALGLAMAAAVAFGYIFNYC